MCLVEKTPPKKKRGQPLKETQLFIGFLYSFVFTAALVQVSEDMSSLRLDRKIPHD